MNLSPANKNLFTISLILYLLRKEHLLKEFEFGQFFNRASELVIPIGIPTKEAKTEIKIHQVTAEAEIIKFLT